MTMFLSNYVRLLRKTNLKPVLKVCSYSVQNLNETQENKNQTHFGYEMVDEDVKTEKGEYSFNYLDDKVR